MTPIRVEVVFALPEEQFLEAVSLAEGATVGDALEAAGLANRFPGEDFAAMPAGIWGEVVERDRCVRDGDRVEVYRPLERDPKEARRELALAGKTMADRPDR